MKIFTWITLILWTDMLALAADQHGAGELALKICDHGITKTAVVDLLIKRYRQQAEDVLHELVFKELINRESQRERLVVPPEAVQAHIKTELDDLRRHVKIKYQTTLEKFLARQKTTLPQYLAQARYRWRNRLAMEYLVRLFEMRQDRVQIRHILVTQESKAREIMRRLQNKADFATLARRESVGKYKGALLPLIFRGDSAAAPAFQRLVFSLAPGTFGGPVHTCLGWHIVKVEKFFRGVPSLNWPLHHTQILASLKQRPVRPLDIQRWMRKLRQRYRIRYLWRQSTPVAFQIDTDKIYKASTFDMLRRRCHEQCLNVMKELLYRYIIKQEAQREGIVVPPRIIQQAVQAEMTRYRQAARQEGQSWRAFLKSQGQTEQNLRQELYTKHFYRLTLERLVRLSQLRLDSVLARQITVRDRRQAEEIMAKLRRHADFAALARQKSIWAPSQGGRLPRIYPGDYDPRLGFERLLFAMRPGEYSGIHHSRMGYHIFQLLKIFPGRRHCRWSEVSREVLQSLKHSAILPRDIERWRRGVEKRYPFKCCYQ